eukprot:TRINITY_DN15879_c0_g1_i1.p1 TRINITY_DN15879_c0_g1~~TRINITY_DN15879_c0_g1_i1.p1  ORF type:complete len:541 (+),score=188.69 TRINITY_DN15879_c0_g1_i1:101-1723(+)
MAEPAGGALPPLRSGPPQQRPASPPQQPQHPQQKRVSSPGSTTSPPGRPVSPPPLEGSARRASSALDSSRCGTPLDSSRSSRRVSLRNAARRVSNAAKAAHEIATAGEAEGLPQPSAERSADPTMKGRERAAQEIKMSHEQRKRETQAALRAIEEQQQRWEFEDASMASWTEQQRRKLDRIQLMIKGEAKGISRRLSAAEIQNLLTMRQELEDEIKKKQEQHRASREREQRIELSAEQRCLLYGLQAQRRARDKTSAYDTRGFAEREKDTMQRLAGAGGAVRTPQPARPKEADSPGEESNPLSPGAVARSEAEMRRAALEKNAAIAATEERWEAEDARHRAWMERQTQRIEELRGRTAAQGAAARHAGRALTDAERALEQELEQLVAAAELRDWQHKESRQWERTQLPELTDDERRILRGIDSVKRLKLEKRRSFAPKGERARDPGGTAPVVRRVSLPGATVLPPATLDEGDLDGATTVVSRPSSAAEEALSGSVPPVTLPDVRRSPHEGPRLRHRPSDAAQPIAPFHAQAAGGAGTAVG